MTFERPVSARRAARVLPALELTAGALVLAAALTLLAPFM